MQRSVVRDAEYPATPFSTIRPDLGLVRLAGIVLLFAATPTWSDQTLIRDYATTREQHFFGLYEGVSTRDATDVYCGVRFKVTPRPSGNGYRTTKDFNIEHAYPAQWMANSLGCGDRKTCPEDPEVGERFGHAEADMHNMWPALARLNSSRGQRLYGEVDAPSPVEIEVGDRTFQCDFKNNGEAVEPRAIVRGNLARSIFYMCREYGFPVPKGMMGLLRQWNRDDPPTPAERSRAEKIAAIQGTRNKFIDNPALGDSVRCKAANW